MLNIGCLEYMATVPDKYFDLAIVDPPYGIGFAGFEKHYGGGKAVAMTTIHKPFSGNDLNPMDESYFIELARVSVNQIIWGANHFISKFPHDSPCWIVWNKKNGQNPFADCELAWTSFDSAVRMFEFRWQGMLQEDMSNKECRIHPTQKPVALYKWLLKNYAKPEMKILDTHGGSFSSALACYDFGTVEYVGCELDKDYFDAAVKRYNYHISQTNLFK